MAICNLGAQFPVVFVEDPNRGRQWLPLHRDSLPPATLEIVNHHVFISTEKPQILIASNCKANLSQQPRTAVVEFLKSLSLKIGCMGVCVPDTLIL